VLKNFPSEAELRSMIDGLGGIAQYWRGAHFWAVCYEMAREQARPGPTDRSRR
jgi:hypothetical protein